MAQSLSAFGIWAFGIVLVAASDIMSVLFSRPFPSLLLAIALVSAGGAQAPVPNLGPAAYTVLSREGRRPLPVRVAAGQEMFALDEVSRLFGLSWREDSVAGGLVFTVPPRNQTIVLSLSQGLASAAGNLVSLPSPPVREGRVWYVPVDFVGRALAAVYPTKIDVRKASRLIVLGDLRVPRVIARNEPLGSMSRVTFDVMPPVPHAVVQENGRLVLRFEADALDASLPGAINGELVAAVRPADAPNAIAIDPGPRYGTYRATDLPGERGSQRIVLEMMSAPAATETTTPGAPGAPEAPALELPSSGGLRTIIIDPGHGGDETGAKGPGGALEKDITLSVARRLKAAIEGRLGIRTLLTRDTDRTMTLDERAALANNNKADLFISLHANASVRAGVVGAEVFYVSLDEYGAEAARATHAESELLPVVGGGSREIQLILWEMAQARYIEQSAALARLVEAELRQRVPMSARAIQQAPFRVLVGANMPAVLVEMGFMTNPAQERALTGDTFQQNIVQGLLGAIIRYRDDVVAAPGTAQPAPKTPAPIH